MTDATMTDTAETLKQAHAELWAFRAEMGDTWPTPDTLDALRFAVTEAGEALDAWMRANRPQYARNRERLNGEEAVLDELADTAMMLLTAMGSGYDFNSVAADRMWGWFEIDRAAEGPVGIEFLVADVSGILLSCIQEDDLPGRRDKTIKSLCILRVYEIATYPGMDLLPRLRSRYARIRAKQHRVRLVEVDGQIGGVCYGAQNATAADVVARQAQEYGTE